MSELIRFSPLPTIKELLRLYNLRAMRQLSQNFLLDLKLTDKIVRAAGDLRDCEVCEVGSGPGAITRSILMTPAKKLVAIEIDRRFEPLLEALKSTVGKRMQIIYANVLNFDFSNIFDPLLKKNWEDAPPNIHIIGNLPFNIANPLLIQFLKDISLRTNAWSYGRVRLTLTFQEEVARRLSSQILSKHRSRISVMCQNWCKVTHKFTIRGCSFLPKPDVNVGVVHVEPLVKPVIDLDFHLIEKVVGVIFNSRRKYCINPAGQLFPESLRKDLVKELFELADVDPKMVPFELGIEDWKGLCFGYKQICDRNPLLYNYNYRGQKSTREEDWKLDLNQMKVSQ